MLPVEAGRSDGNSRQGEHITGLECLSTSGEWRIPRTFGNLTNLQRLNLSYNNLKGPIPGELGNLTNLKELDLSHNRIDGAIPSALDKLTNLERAEFGGQHPWGL
jgi:Leucine-rich repeat (LRR) protein